MRLVLLHKGSKRLFVAITKNMYFLISQLILANCLVIVQFLHSNIALYLFLGNYVLYFYN